MATATGPQSDFRHFGAAFTYNVEQSHFCRLRQLCRLVFPDRQSQCRDDQQTMRCLTINLSSIFLDQKKTKNDIALEGPNVA
jgi:hypothetical protein